MSDTIPSLLLRFVDRDPDAVAVRRRVDGRWVPTTRREVLEHVARAAQALHQRGVSTGSRVALISETRPEWAAIDHAVLGLGGVVVGIYPTLTTEQVLWILRHAQVRWVVVEGGAHAAKVRDLPGVTVVSIDPVDGMDRLVDDVPVAPDAVSWFRAQCAAVRPEQLLSVIYTSGTTGNPKGVVLTHRAMVATCVASREVAPLERGDRSVVFLPLAHSFQRFAGYRGLLEDAEGWYSPSIQDLPTVLRECRPHVLASVPRMLEKIKHRADDAVAARGPRAVAIYRWALAVGRRRAEGGTGLRDRMLHPIADRLVLGKIRERLGGDLRFVVSGSARLDPEVGWWFASIGVPVLEGWGLTETCAPATANRPGQNRIGTVGPPIPGTEIRLAADGEILVRGPGLFEGYLDDPAATAAAFEDGWYKTGDLGAIEPDGSLRIVDRKKEILVTAGGKNIPPVNLELLLGRSPCVAHAVVIGDGRPYVVALLSPDPDAVEGLRQTIGLPPAPLAELVQAPAIRQRFADTVDAANRELARFEQIKRFAVLPRPLSPEHEELTATLKLRRRDIQRVWADTIDALYR